MAVPLNFVERSSKVVQPTPVEAAGGCLGVVLVIAAVVTMFATGDMAGAARLLALAGMGGFGVSAASRARRAYTAGLPGRMPGSVGRVAVRSRPRLAVSVAAVGGAIVLPAAAGVAAILAVVWAWPIVTGLVLVGVIATAVSWSAVDIEYLYPYEESPMAEEQLRRLCMVADIPAPALEVEPGPVATAWTTGGRIHITRRTLELLDDREVEAVLAHEVAHLAHRDAALMDVCAAPSRLLLGYTRYVVPRLFGWVRGCVSTGFFSPAFAIAGLAVLTVPPAFVLGWLSRLSVLALSRSREHAADTAAAALTGRPSALASALMKLEERRDWAPTLDLRQAGADAVLCIVSLDDTSFGRLFASHPPTAARVRRLFALDARVHSGRLR
jgi:heat shock protein HtpX